MASTPTPLQQAGTILKTLLGALAEDGLQAMQSSLVSYGNALQANPSAANVVTQSLALAATAPLQVPNLEAEAIKQMGVAIVALAGLIPSVLVPQPAAA
ncbi:MAG: hypothetical protein ACLPKW_14810 [Acetobacteraceae bacterium]